ncbi:uncharacterized protein LOC129412100 [Boleophthalmus pectinirostris]|uniref:uncharacterized protein LOC129412100 n=1 Tax=Boleophthalmus pectinirostris TaxID=150288 RepID=UPI00242E883B|nr:uncharacterized protein LOC129412100 [Boleophthalmus pectinirostris]
MQSSAGTDFTHRAARLGSLLVLTGALSSAHVTLLSCDVIEVPGGFEYRLSADPGPDCVDRSWQNHDRISLSHGSDFLQDQVQSLTNSSLFLKVCHNYTYFSSQCPGFVEAFCYFNCSSNLKHVDPQKVCVGGSCFEQNNFILVTVAVCFVVLVFFGALWCFYKYKKRRGQRDLLRRAEELDLQSFPLQKMVPLLDQDGRKPDAPDGSPAL